LLHRLRLGLPAEGLRPPLRRSGVCFSPGFLIASAPPAHADVRVRHCPPVHFAVA
jgi:hypothetical protein